MYDIIIIGGGPAGLTAAVYARRAGKTVLVIEKNTFGGQITWSPKVENFPSIPSISGIELGDRLLDQAMCLNTEVELDEVTGLRREGECWTVFCSLGSAFSARAVILAIGAKPRRMGLDEEDRFIGNGISFCAVCDGSFYQNKVVAVAGGGNSALQDAVLLSDLCRKVYVIHRRESFRGEQTLADILRSKENVSLLLDTRIIALSGDSELTGLRLQNGEKAYSLEVDGLFEAIGHQPDTDVFRDLIETDSVGYICAQEDCTTNQPGIFVAGDCRTKKIRQLTTAMADGTSAALAACEWLERN